MSHVVEIVNAPTTPATPPHMTNLSLLVQAPAAPPTSPRPSIGQLEATVESELASFQLAQDEAFARLASLQDSVHRSLRPLIAKAKVDEEALEMQRTQIEGLQQQLRDMEQRMTTSKETSTLDMTRLVQEKDSLEKSLRSERAAIVELEQRTLATEEAEREIRERLRAKEANYERCFADWRAAENRLLETKAVLDQLQSQIEVTKVEYQDKIVEINGHQQVTEEKLESKTKEVSELNQALTAETVRARQKEQDLVKDHESAASALSGELETSRGKLLSKTLLASMLQDALDGLKTQVTALEKQREAAERKISEETSQWTTKLAEKEAESIKLKEGLASAEQLAEKFGRLYSVAEESRAILGKALVHSTVVKDTRDRAIQRLQLRASSRAYADKQRRRVLEKEHATALRSKDDAYAGKMKKAEKDKAALSKTLAAVQEELVDTQSELEGTIKRLKELEETRGNMITPDPPAPPIVGPLLISIRTPVNSQSTDAYQSIIELSKVQADFQDYKERTSRQLALLQEKVANAAHTPASEGDTLVKIRRLEEANRQTERRLRDAVEENVELRERIEGCDELETSLEATRELLRGLEKRLREAVDENADLRRRVGKW